MAKLRQNLDPVCEFFIQKFFEEALIIILPKSQSPLAGTLIFLRKIDITKETRDLYIAQPNAFDICLKSLTLWDQSPYTRQPTVILANALRMSDQLFHQMLMGQLSYIKHFWFDRIDSPHLISIQKSFLQDN
jgi:hypothetical protein